MTVAGGTAPHPVPDRGRLAWALVLGAFVALSLAAGAALFVLLLAGVGSSLISRPPTP